MSSTKPVSAIDNCIVPELILESTSITTINSDVIKEMEDLAIDATQTWNDEKVNDERNILDESISDVVLRFIVNGMTSRQATEETDANAELVYGLRTINGLINAADKIRNTMTDAGNGEGGCASYRQELLETMDTILAEGNHSSDEMKLLIAEIKKKLQTEEGDGDSSSDNDHLDTQDNSESNGIDLQSMPSLLEYSTRDTGLFFPL